MSSADKIGKMAIRTGFDLLCREVLFQVKNPQQHDVHHLRASFQDYAKMLSWYGASQPQFPASDNDLAPVELHQRLMAIATLYLAHQAIVYSEWHPTKPFLSLALTVYESTGWRGFDVVFRHSITDERWLMSFSHLFGEDVDFQSELTWTAIPDFGFHIGRVMAALNVLRHQQERPFYPVELPVPLRNLDPFIAGIKEFTPVNIENLFGKSSFPAIPTAKAYLDHILRLKDFAEESWKVQLTALQPSHLSTDKIASYKRHASNGFDRSQSFTQLVPTKDGLQHTQTISVLYRQPKERFTIHSDVDASSIYQGLGSELARRASRALMFEILRSLDIPSERQRLNTASLTSEQVSLVMSQAEQRGIRPAFVLTSCNLPSDASAQNPFARIRELTLAGVKVYSIRDLGMVPPGLTLVVGEELVSRLMRTAPEVLDPAEDQSSHPDSPLNVILELQMKVGWNPKTAVTEGLYFEHEGYPTMRCFTFEWKGQATSVVVQCNLNEWKEQELLQVGPSTFRLSWIVPQGQKVEYFLFVDGRKVTDNSPGASQVNRRSKKHQKLVQ